MLSLYRYLVLSSAKDTLTQRSHIVMRAMMWLVRMGVLVFLYRVAYLHTQADGLPINLSSALWSIAGYFVLSSLYLRILYRDISDDIQQGSIELHLSKPYNYLLRMMWVRLGRGLPTWAFSCRPDPDPQPTRRLSSGSNDRFVGPQNHVRLFARNPPLPSRLRYGWIKCGMDRRCNPSLLDHRQERHDPGWIIRSYRPLSSLGQLGCRS